MYSFNDEFNNDLINKYIIEFSFFNSFHMIYVIYSILKFENILKAWIFFF